MRSKLNFADIPDKFQGLRLKDLKTSVYDATNKKIALDAFKLVNVWVKNIDEMEEKGQGLYIYSHTKGSGKTRLATSLANELIYGYNKTVKFATSMQIINAIKETWNKQNDNEGKLLNDLANVDYLFIDDFGTEQVKDWLSEKFFSIINDRYTANKVTVVTSNYSIDELAYDDRIKDRLIERCYEIHFAEQSVRRVIAQQNSLKLRGLLNNESKIDS